MKRNYALLLAALVAAVFAVETTNAAVPMLISHQGRLLGTGGVPVTGTRNLTFRIYEVPAGGAALWTEPHLAVPVTAGLFNVTLGSVIPIDGDLVVTSGTLETERYLEVQVEADAPLSPRMRIGSAPLAIASSRVSGDVVTSPGKLVVSIPSGSSSGTISATATAESEESELALVGGGGSTTGTIRMQAMPDSAGSSIGLDLDGDGLPETGNSTESNITRSELKTFF